MSTFTSNWKMTSCFLFAALSSKGCFSLWQHKCVYFYQYNFLCLGVKMFPEGPIACLDFCLPSKWLIAGNTRLISEVKNI